MESLRTQFERPPVKRERLEVADDRPQSEDVVKVESPEELLADKEQEKFKGETRKSPGQF